MSEILRFDLSIPSYYGEATYPIENFVGRITDSIAKEDGTVKDVGKIIAGAIKAYQQGHNGQQAELCWFANELGHRFTEAEPPLHNLAAESYHVAFDFELPYKPSRAVYAANFVFAVERYLKAGQPGKVERTAVLEAQDCIQHFRNRDIYQEAYENSKDGQGGIPWKNQERLEGVNMARQALESARVILSTI